MRKCPTCNRSYDDATTFCLEDGATLVSDDTGEPTMNMPADKQWQPPPPPPVQVAPERKRPTSLMWAGVALVVVGIIIAVGGIAGFIAGGIGTGLAVCALGVLFFCFSFMRLPNVPDGAPKMSTVQTLVGIFFEPTNVFRSLRAHPQWVAAILIAGFMSAAYSHAFVNRLTPERIVSSTVDRLEESAFKPPPEVLDKMRTEEVEKFKGWANQIGNVIKKVVSAFFGVAFLAALCLLGVLAFGGKMHYWQAYAVMAYVNYPVVLLQKAISLLILYLKSPDDIHPIIGQESLVYDNLGFLIAAKDHPVIWVVATSIGVLSFYRLWLTAVGLREGGYKVSSTAGWGVAITLFVLFLLFGMGLAFAFPSFIG